MLLSLLTKLSKDDTVQYLLTLIDDALVEEPRRVAAFHACAAQSPVSEDAPLISLDAEASGDAGGSAAAPSTAPAWPYAPFFKLLQKDDSFIVYKANAVLTALVPTGRALTQQELDFYMPWAAQRLRVADEENLQAMVASLQQLLRIDALRVAFFAGGGVRGLLDVLDARKPNFQMQYQIIFCI